MGSAWPVDGVCVGELPDRVDERPGAFDLREVTCAGQELEAGGGDCSGPVLSPRTTEAAQSEIDRFRAAASGAAPAISASVAGMTIPPPIPAIAWPIQRR